MQKFDLNLYQEQYRIESNRILNYDYSQSNDYFITICTKNMECYFGEIIGFKMILNKWGKIIQQNLLNITKFFNNIILDEFVIMPNHIHIIFEITHDCRDAINRVSTVAIGDGIGGITGKYNPMLNKSSLGYIVRSFKSACTKQIHNIGLYDFAWQSNYYEHIIRNEKSLNNIREYIKNNPYNWINDRNNIYYMPSINQKLGQWGENKAYEYLISKGYKILQRNYHASTLGEIDIIAMQDKQLVFIEVKTKRNQNFGLPEEELTKDKKERLDFSILYYLEVHGLYDQLWRLDLIAIEKLDKKLQLRHYKYVS